MSGATHQALVAALKAHFDEIEREVGPRIARNPAPEFRIPEIANLQVAQNVLRLCLEATLERLLPYTEITPLELAIRLSSYAISAAPAEAQDNLVAAFVAMLPEAHSKRLAAGIRLETGWITEGRERSNFPQADG